MTPRLIPHSQTIVFTPFSCGIFTMIELWSRLLQACRAVYSLIMCCILLSSCLHLKCRQIGSVGLSVIANSTLVGHARSGLRYSCFLSQKRSYRVHGLLIVDFRRHLSPLSRAGLDCEGIICSCV